MRKKKRTLSSPSSTLSTPSPPKALRHNSDRIPIDKPSKNYSEDELSKLSDELNSKYGPTIFSRMLEAKQVKQIAMAAPSATTVELPSAPSQENSPVSKLAMIPPPVTYGGSGHDRLEFGELFSPSPLQKVDPEVDELLQMVPLSINVSPAALCMMETRVTNNKEGTQCTTTTNMEHAKEAAALTLTSLKPPSSHGSPIPLQVITPFDREDGRDLVEVQATTAPNSEIEVGELVPLVPSIQQGESSSNNIDPINSEKLPENLDPLKQGNYSEAAAATITPPDDDALRTANARVNVHEKGKQTNTPWASLLKGEVASRGSTKLTYNPPVLVNGKMMVKSSTTKYQRHIKSCEGYLIGHFIGRKPHFEYVKQQLTRLWNIEGEFSMFSHGERFFLFKFAKDEDREKVKNIGPLHVGNNFFVIRQWRPFIELEPTEQSTIPVWVNIRKVPLHLWNKDGLSDIASSIGIPIVADEITEDKMRLNYARVLVEVTPENLPSFATLMLDEEEPLYFPVEYPWKPTVCKLCGLFGHGQDQCPSSKTLGPPKPPPRKAPSHVDKGKQVSNKDWQLVSNNRHRRHQQLSQVPNNPSRSNIDSMPSMTTLETSTSTIEATKNALAAAFSEKLGKCGYSYGTTVPNGASGTNETTSKPTHNDTAAYSYGTPVPCGNSAACSTKQHSNTSVPHGTQGKCSPQPHGAMQHLYTTVPSSSQGNFSSYPLPSQRSNEATPVQPPTLALHRFRSSDSAYDNGSLHLCNGTVAKDSSVSSSPLSLQLSNGVAPEQPSSSALHQLSNSSDAYDLPGNIQDSNGSKQYSIGAVANGSNQDSKGAVANGSNQEFNCSKQYPNGVVVNGGSSAGIRASQPALQTKNLAGCNPNLVNAPSPAMHTEIHSVPKSSNTKGTRDMAINTGLQGF